MPLRIGLSSLCIGSKSSGLGPELVVNGTFPANVASWSDTSASYGGTGTLAWDATNGGQLKMTLNTAAAVASQGITVTPGASYRFQGSITSSVKGKVREQNSGTVFAVRSSAGTTAWDQIVVFPFGSFFIDLMVADNAAFGSATDFITVDNVSLRKVL